MRMINWFWTKIRCFVNNSWEFKFKIPNLRFLQNWIEKNNFMCWEINSVVFKWLKTSSSAWEKSKKSRTHKSSVCCNRAKKCLANGHFEKQVLFWIWYIMIISAAKMIFFQQLRPIIKSFGVDFRCLWVLYSALLWCCSFFILYFCTCYTQLFALICHEQSEGFIVTIVFIIRTAALIAFTAQEVAPDRLATALIFATRFIWQSMSIFADFWCICTSATDRIVFDVQSFRAAIGKPPTLGVIYQKHHAQ